MPPPRPGVTAPSGKPIGLKPAPGPQERILAGMDAGGRADAKAQLHNDARHAMVFTEGDCNVVLTSIGYSRGLLECVVLSATVGGKPVPLDNPYQFVNPPLKVPDGTVRIETVNGRDVEVANMKEDPVAAFRAMLADALRKQAI